LRCNVRYKLEGNPGVVAYVIRNGYRTKTWLGMVLTKEEFDSLEVVEGTMLYSIDEKTLHTITAPKPEPVVEKPVAPTGKKRKIILDDYKTDLE